MALTRRELLRTAGATLGAAGVATLLPYPTEAATPSAADDYLWFYFPSGAESMEPGDVLTLTETGLVKSQAFEMVAGVYAPRKPRRHGAGIDVPVAIQGVVPVKVWAIDTLAVNTHAIRPGDHLGTFYKGPPGVACNGGGTRFAIALAAVKAGEKATIPVLLRF